MLCHVGYETLNIIPARALEAMLVMLEALPGATVVGRLDEVHDNTYQGESK